MTQREPMHAYGEHENSVQKDPRLGFKPRTFVLEGTFLGRTAAHSENDCEACHRGMYCPSWAQTSVDLLCPPGWFCPTGSSSGHQT
ncbi:hypothetical protein ATANTOWER_014621, partial [Ataeniobius toweri]|nr:hypothetical protein [Ataeniobius toweri]